VTQRPAEFENLIKTRALEAVAQTPGAIAGFLRNAAHYEAAALALDSEKDAFLVKRECVTAVAR